MSIERMTDVWKFSRAKSNTLLVLLALADNADSESGLAWPSVASLAQRARVSERSVQRALRELEGLDEIAVVRPGGRHDGKYRSTVYRVLLQGRQPDTPAAQGRQTGSPRGDKTGRSGVTPLSPQPSVEPSLEPSERCLFTAEDEALGLCEFWKQTMDKPRARIKKGDERYRKVRARLKDGYSSDEIRQAIRNVAGSEWHRENDQVSLTLICRDGDHLEKYRDGQFNGRARVESTDEFVRRRQQALLDDAAG